MSTWNDVRRNLNDRLNRTDYADMSEVRAGNVRKSESGRDMIRVRLGPDRSEDRPRSMRKLRRLGMVPEITAGEYALTTPGDAALDEWLANRPTYPTPTEGPSS